MIPDKLDRRGAKPLYHFDTMEPGKENGKEYLCKPTERDAKWHSIRALCYKNSKEGKEFKCYVTELGVFYWREK